MNAILASRQQTSQMTFTQYSYEVMAMVETICQTAILDMYRVFHELPQFGYEAGEYEGHQVSLLKLSEDYATPIFILTVDGIEYASIIEASRAIALSFLQ